MNKYFIVLLTAGILFVPIGYSLNIDARQSVSKLARAVSTPKNKIEIAAVNLDKYEAELRCPREEYGGIQTEGAVCSEDPSIKIKTSVINPRNSEITYHYTVSGGKIVGRGANVTWDLKGVRPGNYTVTVGIGDRFGVLAETITETILIRECGTCDLPCVCPTLTVNGAEKVRASESLVFSAKVEGGSDTSGLTYKWTVSQGEIVKGQGTAVIKVKTTKEMSGAIKASVEIAAPGLCSACSIITESKTAAIIK